MTWSAEDEQWGRKVGYWTTYVRDGVPLPRETTAYLHGELEDDIYWGTNKHTDEPIVVRWDEALMRYVEVPERNDEAAALDAARARELYG